MSFKQERTVRVAIPALASLASTALAVTWSPPLPSAAYSVTYSVEDPASLAAVQSVTAKTATGCTLNVKNVGLTSLLASTAFVDLIAQFD